MDVTSPHDDLDDQLHITAGAEGTVVVELRGEIDLGNAAEIGAEISKSVGDQARVVFDLSGVEFMDTSGLAVLLTVARTAASVLIRNPSMQVRRVIESTGLQTTLRMTP